MQALFFNGYGLANQSEKWLPLERQFVLYRFQKMEHGAMNEHTEKQSAWEGEICKERKKEREGGKKGGRGKRR